MKKILPFLLLSISLSLFAQESFPKLKVYIECGVYDIDYIQKELKNINFLRDSKHAHVHILVRAKVHGIL
jgi:hypothetical protein